MPCASIVGLSSLCTGAKHGAAITREGTLVKACGQCGLVERKPLYVPKEGSGHGLTHELRDRRGDKTQGLSSHGGPNCSGDSAFTHISCRQSTQRKIQMETERNRKSKDSKCIAGRRKTLPLHCELWPQVNNNEGSDHSLIVILW
jgi:hypothetical protein